MFKIPTKSKTLIAFLLIILIAIMSTYYSYYQNTIKIIRSEHESKINLIEQTIYNETKYSEIINKIAEKDLDKDMESASYQLIELYRHNPHVLTWDLQNLKQKIGGLDIYIIDDQLTVISSSIKDEVGISFNNFPQFSRTLRNRLNNDQFRADSINYSFTEKELKKYSYMPTPDHKYLIELSVNIKEHYPELQSLDILYLSQSLKSKYPFVESIKVYKYDVDSEKTERMFNDAEEAKSKAIFKKNKELIKKAIESIEVQKQIIQEEGQYYTIKYIPYYLMNSEIRMNWWGTYLIEIIYNDHELIQNIARQKSIFAQSMVPTFILYIAFILMLLYTIQQSQEMAYTDCLTGLPNRKKFEQFLHEKIPQAQKKKNKIAVYFFDLDSFKKVNDTYGHNVGDRLLQEVASRIKTAFPDCSIVSRVGGDEFVAAIPDLENNDEAINHINKILNNLENEVTINNHRIPVKVSIGISILPHDGDSVEELISKADTAMYHAKQNQLDYCIFSHQPTATD